MNEATEKDNKYSEKKEIIIIAYIAKVKFLTTPLDAKESVQLPRTKLFLLGQDSIKNILKLRNFC